MVYFLDYTSKFEKCRFVKYTNKFLMITNKKNNKHNPMHANIFMITNSYELSTLYELNYQRIEFNTTNLIWTMQCIKIILFSFFGAGICQSKIIWINQKKTMQPYKNLTW